MDCVKGAFKGCRKIMGCRGCAILLSFGILFGGFLLCIGCRGDSVEGRNPVLISVDKKVVTVSDFKAAYEIKKTAYSPSDLKDPRFLQGIRLGVLSQLTDELVLLNRAEELDLQVTDEELLTTVSEIRADYPDDTFNQTLIEASIPLSLWRDGLKKRLLLEKVIKTDLEDRILVSPGDIDEFFNDEKKAPAGLAREAESVVRQLKRKKAEDIYPSWISDLRRRYDITINEELLEKI